MTNPTFTGKDFDAADHLGEVRRREDPPPATVWCKHEWPEGKFGVDINGSCMKCGMSFARYIYTECP